MQLPCSCYEMIELFGQVICEQKRNMHKTQRRQELKQRKIYIAQALESTKTLRLRIKEYQKQLEYSYIQGKISYTQYKASQERVFQGRSAHDWIQYYDQCISYYQKEMDQKELFFAEEKQKTRQLISLFLILGFVSLLGFSAYTGFDTMIEFVSNTSLEEIPPSEEILVPDIGIEAENGSESTESAADIPE